MSDTTALLQKLALKAELLKDREKFQENERREKEKLLKQVEAVEVGRIFINQVNRALENSNGKTREKIWLDQRILDEDFEKVTKEKAIFDFVQIMATCRRCKRGHPVTASEPDRDCPRCSTCGACDWGGHCDSGMSK